MQEAQNAIVKLLKLAGEDVEREGLLETPKRVVEAYKFLLSGYNQNPNDLMKTFDGSGCNEMVLLKNLEFYSLCEHHILPFYGHVHLSYIPNERVIGVSKLARIVEMFARRLQIQEKLGEQITDCIMDGLKPKGAGCIIQASHLCMRMRGVQKQESVMVTSSLKGVFLTNEKTRAEFLSLIKL